MTCFQWVFFVFWNDPAAFSDCLLLAVPDMLRARAASRCSCCRQGRFVSAIFIRQKLNAEVVKAGEGQNQMVCPVRPNRIPAKAKIQSQVTTKKYERGVKQELVGNMTKRWAEGQTQGLIYSRKGELMRLRWNQSGWDRQSTDRKWAMRQDTQGKDSNTKQEIQITKHKEY